MKILRIIARLNVGGPARHVVWLTKELQDNEFQSVLIAGKVPDGEEDMAYFANENGVEPIFIDQMSRELSLDDLNVLLKIYRLIKFERPDIIHTHTAKAGTIGRAAAFLYRWLTWATLIGKPRKVKIVHTFHGHIFHSYYGKLKIKIFLVIEKVLAWIATDRIIVLTKQQYEEIHEKYGVGKAKQFEVVPLGIDLREFRSSQENGEVFRNEIKAGNGEIVVGFVGRLTEIKNLSLLLKVAEIYQEQQNSATPRLKFVIIGDGHLRVELEKEADKVGVRGLVTFLGNRTDAGRFYAGLDIVALTSLNEGTPLSLIEAMASGTPVISTAVGGVIDLLGEICEENKGFQVCERGIGIESNFAGGFYNGLIYLAKNEKLRGRLAGSGKEFVETQYAKARLISDIKSLYGDLVSEKE